MFQMKEGHQDNRRIKSFLSPFSKFGTRSLSTSDSCGGFIRDSGDHTKSYIQFRKINRPNGEIVTHKISNTKKAEQFHKKQNSKLLKCTINKNNQYLTLKNDRQRINDDKQLLGIVRQLREKVKDLEIQNRQLIQKQQEDAHKINKQSEIIWNLQEAINLARGKSYSVGMVKHKNGNEESEQMEWLRVQKECRRKQKQLQAKICQLRLQNVRLSESYSRVLEELELQKVRQISFGSTSTKQQKKRSNSFRKQHEQVQQSKVRQINTLELLLAEIELRKRKQFQQIDSLLLSSRFTNF